jgi:precorrin-2 C20-methyltransferase/precorrin-3B C17-methyltransferase
MTVKASNAVGRAHIIYHAGPRPDQGRAWEVVRHLVRPEQQVRLLLSGSMRAASAEKDRAAYRPAVEQIAADCRAGLNVVLVTEGDPTLYSSTSYVWQLLAAHHPDVPVEVIPGVTSVTAAAARVGWPLAQRDEMLAILPASYRAAEVREALDRFETVCLLKVPQAFPEVAELLAGRADCEAVYLEDVTTAAEWVTHDLPSARGRSHYFALVLVRRRRTEPGQAVPRRLWVIGLGPGDPALLTPQAERALRSAEVIVGYEAYLEALRPLRLVGELRGSPIGAESERAALALELAAAGKRVALVSSGDAGVYGMASLVLETAERAPAVEVEVVPGVTAALSAAALLGAPLGHDFACISLSDLLTPWPVIERRLEAAGQGDFVVALYNPLSRRRTWQLPRARELLLRHRGAETPVGLADRAYRPGGRVWRTTLGELDGAGVGMETVLIVGNSQTRVIHGRMVTPRGYGSPP